MRPRRHAVSFPRRALLAVLAAAAFAGCTPVMSTESAPATPDNVVPTEFPLRFRTHSFEAHCYDTIDCNVVYNHRSQIEQEDGRVAPARATDYQNGWGGGPELGIRNFPPPARVTWKSLDGTQHAATVDIEAIFADERVLHHVPEQDIPTGWAHDVSPLIVLVVNDRTIEVYMRTHIATKQPQEANNPYSDYRVEVVRAWSRTY